MLSNAEWNTYNAASLPLKYLDAHMFQTAQVMGTSFWSNVHDKLGNLREAAHYYEHAKHQLATGPLPQAERGVFSRRRRAELMRQVQQRLEREEKMRAEVAAAVQSMVATQVMPQLQMQQQMQMQMQAAVPCSPGKRPRPEACV